MKGQTVLLASGGCEPPGASAYRGVHTPRSPIGYRRAQHTGTARGTTRMRRGSLNLRWGKVLTWGLVTLAGAGALAALFFLFPQWRSARGDGPGSAATREEKEAPRLKRLAED